MTERRIKKELSDLRIQMNEDNSIRNLIVDENNLFEWKLTICLADELKADLQDLRDEALVNDTIRNILIDENYLNEWRFSIYPRDLPFNVASFGILINFPGTLN